jgi:hypothetical protein
MALTASYATACPYVAHVVGLADDRPDVLDDNVIRPVHCDASIKHYCHPQSLCLTEAFQELFGIFEVR